MASLCKPQIFVKSAILAEVHVLWRYLIFYLEIGLDEVIFEGNVLSVVKDVHKHQENWVWYGQMIEDIKWIVSARQSWRIQYVLREGNKATHRFTSL